MVAGYQILFFPLAVFVFECEHHIYTCKDKYVSLVTQGFFGVTFLMQTILAIDVRLRVRAQLDGTNPVGRGSL